MTQRAPHSPLRSFAFVVLTTTALLASPAYAAPGPEKTDTMMKQEKTDMMKADAMKADGMKMHDKADTMMAHKDMMTPALFQKKTYALKGAVTVEQRGDQTVIVFSDDFRTKKGPDLKVFLSKNAVSAATGTNATTDAVRLGALSSNKGAQEYVLPAGVTLSDYSSVLVHCEAFSKLWGGADIS